METIFGSRQVTKFTNNGKEYSIVLQGDLKDRTEPSNLNKVYVRSDITKKLIPLSNVIKISESAAAPFLSRYQRQRAVTISARLVGDYTIGEALEYLNNIVKENFLQKFVSITRESLKNTKKNKRWNLPNFCSCISNCLSIYGSTI